MTPTCTAGRRIGKLAATLALIACAGTADAQGWYAGANLPVAYIDDTLTETTGDVRVPPIKYGGEATTEHGTGLKLAALLGYDFDNRWRIDAEAFWATADVEKLSYANVTVPAYSFRLPERVPVPVDGRVNQFGALVNVWYDFAQWGKWTPYAGGGIGLIRVDQSDVRYDDTALAQHVADALARAQGSPTVPFPDGYVPPVSSTDNVVAFQLGAGVGYEFTANTTLQIGYRWQQTDELLFDGQNENAVVEATTRLRTHFIEVGVRYRF